MTETVAVPLWLLILIVALAAVALLSHVLVPSVRWYFRRRMERVVARLNERLERPIRPFKLMRRQDMIVRLVHDPAVMEAVVEHARTTGEPESVAFQQAQAYAREIVPSFSATVYFGFATRAARLISRAFYDVHVGASAPAVGAVDPDATVVFIMNHRSNMDYVLVTWVVANRSALSYAVGEWARVWPLSRLIRAMGAYFIRRSGFTPLYRRVLGRFVQMTTAEGSTQAIFPEGGLSLDGRTGPPKLGLLRDIVTGFDPARRDVVFLPVALAYDRVMEDRLLVEARLSGTRRFRAAPMSILGFAARIAGQKLRGRFPGFGTAAVSFGAPLSLRQHLAGSGGRAGTPETAEAQVAALAARLMAAVTEALTVLPVPLVAAVLAGGALPAGDLPAQVTAAADRLKAIGARLYLPNGGPAEAAEIGVRALTQRGIVAERDGVLSVVAGKAALLDFQAGPVLQRLEAGGSICGQRMAAASQRT
jgi:glycerol-3-phosphate O-acyltransferase